MKSENVNFLTRTLIWNSFGTWSQMERQCSSREKAVLGLLPLPNLGGFAPKSRLDTKQLL